VSDSPAPHRVLVVGCGKGGDGVGGHSIGYAHGRDWHASPRATLVGAVDLVPELAARFAETFNIPHHGTGLDAVLAASQPDIVSLCTYAGARPPIIETCLRHGVRGIWCEKPFALTMDAARAMVAACEAAGARMIVNHCRRDMPAFRRVKELLDAGAIGEPMLMTAAIPGWDQMEWGTHWHDMFRMWAGDQPVDWVMGQARCTGERRGYGHPIEEASVGYYAFRDGTRALLDGGVTFRGEAALSILGSHGVIHLDRDGTIRLINGDGEKVITGLGGIHPPPYGSRESLLIPHALLDWMEGGPVPSIAASNGLLSTELYLAVYESAARRDRIDLPLGAQCEFPLDRLAAGD